MRIINNVEVTKKEEVKNVQQEYLEVENKK
jgi:hypothetical protein